MQKKKQIPYCRWGPRPPSGMVFKCAGKIAHCVLSPSSRATAALPTCPARSRSPRQASPPRQPWRSRRSRSPTPSSRWTVRPRSPSPPPPRQIYLAPTAPLAYRYFKRYIPCAEFCFLPRRLAERSARSNHRSAPLFFFDL